MSKTLAILILVIGLLLMANITQLFGNPGQLSKTEQLGNPEQLQKVQQLNVRLDKLTERCNQLEKQNIETLKRWKDIEGSYKAMYEIFNNQFGSDEH